MTHPASALRDRARLYGAVRGLLDARGFLEAETPLLTPAPIPEASIELFRTDRLVPGGPPAPLWLVPSPEVWMKRLLAAGSGPIYQISKCFRNGEQIGRWHRAEFSMLEWYEPGADSGAAVRLVESLLEAAAGVLRPEGVPDALAPPIRRITMEEAFVRWAGFSLEADLDAAGWNAPVVPAEAPGLLAGILSARLAERGLPAGSPGEAPDDLFHRLFLTLVEDELPTDRPLALADWPALVPTTARRRPGTPWAERWELYLKGVEAANCYEEETDPAALAAFWAAEAPRKAAAAVPVPEDARWLEAVSGTMPPSSGAAVGLDRLLALYRGDEGLEGLDLFPIRDMIGGN